MSSILPWEKPRIKRILELFTGSKVLNIKKMSTISKEVKQDDIQR